MGAALRLLMGALPLVFKLVKFVRELPKESAFGVVYLSPGNTSGISVATLEAKGKLLASGGEAAFPDLNLNLWGPSLLVRKTPATGAAKRSKDKPEKKSTWVILKTPNLRLLDKSIPDYLHLWLYRDGTDRGGLLS